MYLNNCECCGVQEISDLGNNRTTEEAIRKLLYEYKDERFGALFFTSTNSQNNYSPGKRLAAYIKKNKLGTTIATKPFYNRNSGNKVKMWTWTVNNKKLQALCKKMNWDEYDDDCDPWGY